MRAMVRIWTCVMFALLIGMSCKKERIDKRALVKDLPAGYALEEDKSAGVVLDSRKTAYAPGSFVQMERPKHEERLEPSESVEAVDQDVELRLWKSQPKVFIHSQ